MIYSVQYLRFFAALLVVICHATQSLQKDLHSPLFTTWGAGVRGVDIFFVLSGFIIYHVTQDTGGNVRSFLSKRFWRVAPIYYLASLAILAIAVLKPGLLASTRIDLVHVVSSFLFIPADHPVTLSTLPLLAVGWTLNSEIQFYLIFALVLPLAPGIRLAAASAVILGLVLAGQIFQPSHQTLAAWSAPILIEFIFGMILGWLWQNVPGAGFSRAGSALAALALTAGLAGILMIPAQYTDGVLQRDSRWLLAGAPAMLLVGGALLAERQGLVPKWGYLRLLGDASYSLYIWHFFVIGALRAVWPVSMRGDLLAEVSFLAACTIISIFVSLLSYRYIERPVAAFAAQRSAAKAGGQILA